MTPLSVASNLLRKLSLASQLRRNALSSGGQAIVAMVCMFAAYRVLLVEAGAERMGLWALLSAGAAAGRVGDVSGAGGLGRFVAESRSLEGRPSAAAYIHTVTAASTVFNLALAALGLICAPMLVDRFAPHQFVAEARAIVPLVILAVIVLGPIASALSSAVDGLKRADIRSAIMSCSYLIFLAVVLVPVGGDPLLRFAVAAIVQQLFVIVLAWGVLRTHIAGIGWGPYRWSPDVFRETFGYGLKLQLNGLAGILSDPVAKMALGYWGGLSAVASFELAARLVTSLRGLVVQGLNPLIPEFAARRSDRAGLIALLRRTTTASGAAGLGLCVIGAAASPVFSLVMLGRFDWELVVFVVALGAGYGVNALSIPFYFAGLGTGVIGWNIASQAVMAGSVLIIGGALGPLMGGWGVIASFVIGLWLGALVTALGNARNLGLSPDLKPVWRRCALIWSANLAVALAAGGLLALGVRLVGDRPGWL